MIHTHINTQKKEATNNNGENNTNTDRQADRQTDTDFIYILICIYVVCALGNIKEPLHSIQINTTVVHINSLLNLTISENDDYANLHTMLTTTHK